MTTSDAPAPGTIGAVRFESETLAENPTQLPMGLFGPEGRQRDCAFRRPTMGLRRRIGALKTRKDLRHKLGLFISAYVTTACSVIAGQDLDKLSEAQRMLLVGRLSVGDVLWLMAAVQFGADPEGVSLEDRVCGACGGELGAIQLDLSGLRVDVLPDSDPDGRPYSVEHPPAVQVVLRDGIPYKGQTIRRVQMQPPVWGRTFAAVKNELLNNNVVLEQLLFRSAIRQVDINPHLKELPQPVLDELMPHDTRLLNAGVEAVSASPDFRVEFICPFCGAEQTEVLPWNDARFFSLLG